MGKLQESAELQRDTLARREALDGTPRAHKLAVTLINLAMTESSLGELAEARKWADRGFKLAQKYVKEDDPRFSTILHNYGMVLDRIGSRSEAQEYFERALDLRLKQDDTQGAIEALASLAAAFYDVGRYDESDRRYNEAYRLAQQRLPPLHSMRGQIGRSWCRVLSSIGKLQQSPAICDEAIKVFSARAEEGQLQVHLTQINRGVTLGLLGRALRSHPHPPCRRPRTSSDSSRWQSRSLRGRSLPRRRLHRLRQHRRRRHPTCHRTQGAARAPRPAPSGRHPHPRQLRCRPRRARQAARSRKRAHRLCHQGGHNAWPLRPQRTHRSRRFQPLRLHPHVPRQAHDFRGPLPSRLRPDRKHEGEAPGGPHPQSSLVRLRHYFRTRLDR